MPTKNNDFTGLYLLAVVGMAVDVFFSYNNILTEYMIIPRLIYVPSYILSGIVIIRDSIRADKERFEQTMLTAKHAAVIAWPKRAHRKREKNNGVIFSQTVVYYLNKWPSKF